MKKLMAWVLGAGLATPLVGLMGGCCPPTAEDHQDHVRRISRNAHLECNQVTDDLDYLFLVDKPSTLTPYPMPDKPH